MVDHDFPKGYRERKVIAQRFLSAEAFDAFRAFLARTEPQRFITDVWSKTKSPYTVDAQKLLDTHDFTGEELDREFDDDLEYEPEDLVDFYRGRGAQFLYRELEELNFDT